MVSAAPDGYKIKVGSTAAMTCLILDNTVVACGLGAVCGCEPTLLGLLQEEENVPFLTAEEGQQG